MTCGGRDLLSPLSTSSRHACTTFYSRNSKLHFSAGRGSARCSTLCRQDDHGQRRLFVLLCVAGAFDIRHLRYRAPPREQLRNPLIKHSVAISTERGVLFRANHFRVATDVD